LANGICDDLRKTPESQPEIRAAPSGEQPGALPVGAEKIWGFRHAESFEAIG
jgi:hypothetical protein